MGLMALRCAAGGGGAYLTPPRSRCCGASAARPAVTTTGTRALRLLLSSPSSPCSKTPRALRCSPDSPPEQQHVPGRKEGTADAREALKAMVADMFMPLLRNISDMLSLRTVYDLEDYQVGMLSGAFLGCVGCYQLWKDAPSVFVDAALAYGFYKLSVVSSGLRRQGKCNDLLARLKFGIVAIMATRDFRKSYELMDFVKLPVFFLYLLTFIFDMGRVKKDAKEEPSPDMVALRCSGGAAAYLAAQRITSPQNGDGRSAVLAIRAGIREFPRRASSSPSSPSPWIVRCSAGRPPRVKRRCFQNKGVTEGWEALKAAAADMFRPLRLNLSDMRSSNTVYDLVDYQIGMLYGTIAGCVGCYQLWKASPPIFVDAALGYIIYKLSVISSELHRQCKSNSLITRLKFGFILFMALKDFHNEYVFLDAIRLPLFFLYVGAFMFDVAGLKKYGRPILISFVNLLKRRGGIEEIFRIVWWRGYVSPYDDMFGQR